MGVGLAQLTHPRGNVSSKCTSVLTVALNDTSRTAFSPLETSGEVVGLKTSGIGFIRPHTGKVDDKDVLHRGW